MHCQDGCVEYVDFINGFGFNPAYRPGNGIGFNDRTEQVTLFF
jgi:hypothetical protein